jgi:hypothetical protein
MGLYGETTMKKVLLSLFVLSSVTGCGINTTSGKYSILRGQPGTWSYHPNGYDIETGEEYRERRWGHLAWEMKQKQEGNSDWNSPLQREGEKYERGQSPYERKLRDRRETEMKGTQNES